MTVHTPPDKATPGMLSLAICDTRIDVCGLTSCIMQPSGNHLVMSLFACMHHVVCCNYSFIYNFYQLVSHEGCNVLALSSAFVQCLMQQLLSTHRPQPSQCTPCLTAYWSIQSRALVLAFTQCALPHHCLKVSQPTPMSTLHDTNARIPYHHPEAAWLGCPQTAHCCLLLLTAACSA